MEELLIEKVRQLANLYNIKSTCYRDQHMRRESWEEIGKDVNMTADKAKERWDKLRRCFANALNRRKIRKSGDEGKKISPWKYEQQMSFLLPYLENRRTHGNLEPTHSQEDESKDDTLLAAEDQQQEEEDFEPQETLNFDLGHRNNSEQVAGPSQNPANLQPASQNIVTQHLQNLKRRKREGNVDPVQEMVNVMRETAEVRKRKYLEKVTSKQDDLDESVMFYLSMSRSAKRLPAIDQARIKLSLSQSIFQAEIKDAEGKALMIGQSPQQFMSRPSSGSNSSDISLIEETV